MKKQNRRSFLQFLGRTGMGLGASAFLVNLQACTPSEKPKDPSLEKPKARIFPLQDIEHSLEDKLVLANGLEYDILIKWNDPISDTDHGTVIDKLLPKLTLKYTIVNNTN